MRWKALRVKDNTSARAYPIESLPNSDGRVERVTFTRTPSITDANFDAFIKTGLLVEVDLPRMKVSEVCELLGSPEAVVKKAIALEAMGRSPAEVAKGLGMPVDAWDGAEDAARDILAGRKKDVILRNREASIAERADKLHELCGEHEKTIATLRGDLAEAKRERDHFRSIVTLPNRAAEDATTELDRIRQMLSFVDVGDGEWTIRSAIETLIGRASLAEGA